METNLEVLNKISAKLGGNADATSVTESLNNIANALGDTEPDVIKSVSDSLNDILEYAGQGGGSVDISPVLTITIDNSASSNPVKATGWELDGNNITQKSPIEINAGDTGTIETLVFGKFNIIENELYYGILPEDVMNGNIDSYDDLVNCTEEADVIYITDPSQPASCTFVIHGGLS